MGKFDGYLICTDLDGTLLRNDKQISEENLKAIAYFQQEGGIFTFITGRMPFFVDGVLSQVTPNGPFGCVNGGGLYDHKKQEYLWKGVMPPHVTELIECVDKTIPGIGIQVNTFHHVYFCRENETMEIFRRLTGLPNLVCDYHAVKEPIAKIIFGSESDDEIQLIEKTLRSHPKAKEFDFIQSERTLFEILPKGIGKGTAISNLVRLLNLDIRKTIAIGDYNNDISMFRAAQVGVAVANACPDALAAADYITVSNEEHAVAQVIYDLEAGKLPF